MAMLTRGGWMLLLVLLFVAVAMGCSPDGGGNGATVGSLALEVSAPAGAPEVWAILFQDQRRRSVVLDVELATGAATGSIDGLAPGAWRVFLLSSGDVDLKVSQAHSVETVTIAAGERATLSSTLVPIFGIIRELTFNPSGPVFTGTGKLNPFAVPRVRQAVNMLLDRDALSQLVADDSPTATGVFPAFTPTVVASADYRDMTAFFEGVEQAYAVDVGAASEVIGEEMVDLGAELVDGVWHYDGEPVTIIVLIRNEDERVLLGDYVADRLDQVGFVTQRDYLSSAEASPIWLNGDPEDGLFHVYTGGWVRHTPATAVDVDYSFYFTPDGIASPLWEAYEPSPEFYEVATRLAEGDYADAAERRTLLQQAVTLSLEDSVRVFLVERYVEPVIVGAIDALDGVR